MLGIRYDLEQLWEGKLTVQNKPGRCDRVKSLKTELRKLGGGLRSAAASLAGILNFCGDFVRRHTLKPATHASSKWSIGANMSTATTHEMRGMIEFLVEASKPGLIAMDRDLPSIIVYMMAPSKREKVGLQTKLDLASCIGLVDYETCRLGLKKRSSPSTALFLLRVQFQ